MVTLIRSVSMAGMARPVLGYGKTKSGMACAFVAACVLVFTGASGAAPAEPGRPPIQSISALAFGPDGVLFIGDGKAAAVHAVALEDKTPLQPTERLAIPDIEERIAALLGTKADLVMIHDLAVNPLSSNIYLAVSRGRGRWDSSWTLPNDIADADVLLRISPDQKLAAVDLDRLARTTAALPNPVDPAKKHPWKKEFSLRADTITDMAHMDGTLYVAGLSNEEFSSTMWKLPYPFSGRAEMTTLEIFHGAHGEYETNAPIRTFLPYTLKGEKFLLAAYLCTPLVTFKASEMAHGKHLKGRTIGEFGSGNYPLDMVAYVKEGREKLLIANSNLPFMIVDPAGIEAYDGAITTAVAGYTAGVPYEIRSGAGVQQMDTYGDRFVLTLRRLPGGTLALESMPIERF